MSIGNAYADIPVSHWFQELIQTLMGIIANLTCLLYVLWKLKINSHIRHILLLAIIGTMICQAVGVCGSGIMYFLEWKDLWLCILFILPKYINGLIVSHAAMAIAVVRYYLATKTSKVEAINHTAIKIFTKLICALIPLYTVTLALVPVASDSMSIGPKIAECSGRQPNLIEIPTAIILSASYIACAIGILHDVAMSRFLKRQNNKTGPVEMAVWSVNVGLPANPNNQDPVNKLTVPVKATIIGNLFLITLSVTIGFFLARHHSPLWSNFGNTMAVVLRSFYEFYMLFIVVFTIKSNEKSLENNIQVIQPPAGLQFHDEAEDSSIKTDVVNDGGSNI